MTRVTIASLQMQNDDLSNQLFHANEAITTKNQVIERLTKESDTASGANAQLEKELYSLRDKLAETRDELNKANKDLESTKSTQKWYNDRASKAEGELEQLHAAFDGINNAPARKYTPPGQTYEAERTVMTRFVGTMLAIQRGAL